MTPEMKSKWIAALRSGKFKQTKGLLKDSDGYCCLGVLASINGNEPNTEGEVEGCWDDPEGFPRSGAWKDADGMLPHPLAEQFGISPGWMDYFAGLNDGGAPFSAIADELESMLPSVLGRDIGVI